MGVAGFDDAVTLVNLSQLQQARNEWSARRSQSWSSGSRVQAAREGRLKSVKGRSLLLWTAPKRSKASWGKEGRSCGEKEEGPPRTGSRKKP